MTKLFRAAAVVVIAALPILTQVGTANAAPPATTAATAHCNDFTVENVGNGRVGLLPSVGSNTHQHNCLLSRGDTGAGVFVLQVALHECNLHSGLARDGAFGPQTEAAVRAAQSAYRITVDGVYGPQTRNALQWPLVSATDFSQVLSCSGRFIG